MKKWGTFLSTVWLGLSTHKIAQLFDYAWNHYRRSLSNYPDVCRQGFYSTNPLQYREHGGEPGYHQQWRIMSFGPEEWEVPAAAPKH